MLSRSDLRSDLYPHPTHTPYKHPASVSNDLYRNQSLSMDPNAVDFRAFYPYTPNEVKHRKRTTPNQLKTLEGIFKRDTKPNGPRRIELATQLGMTPRGVQVWFQNRRAKEKIKAGKASKGDRTDASSQDQPESPDDADVPESPVDATRGDASSHSSTPDSASPLPKLQVVHEPSQPTWEDAPIDTHSLHVDTNLQAHRRGSLPVLAFSYNDFSPSSPPSLDASDPFARRLSVDASLQRLANNPYAHLARAKNNAAFGPRATAPTGHRQVGRVPYAPRPQRSSTSMPYRSDARRASVGIFHFSPRGTASPSPSPLSPYNVVRSSLPEHHLYTVTSRVVSSPIPGPLPSPNFSFGAANTPSMASASSGDSERNSPDSLQSFAYREMEHEEEDGTPSSYYPLSRFGSITSIATSDSSINSSYYPDVVGCYADNEPDFGRRDSCASGHFASLMSGLDVNGMQESLVNPREHDAYALHEDIHAPGIVRVGSNGICVETSAYPSPTSTISPGPGGSPHAVHNGSAASLPISRSSELAFALQSQSEQVKSAPLERTAFLSSSAGSPAESSRPDEQYFYGGQEQPQPAPAPVEFDDKYNYDFDPSGSYLTENYSLLESSTELALHHAPYDAALGPLQNADQYAAYA